MHRVIFLFVTVVVLAGCSGSTYPLVPVSGEVTLDGSPLPKARIAFEPKSGGGSVIAGPGAYAETDESGRYTLADIKSRRGAVTGPHRVSITTLRVREDANGQTTVMTAEQVPERYQASDALTFDVPSGGTDAADFHLSTK